MDDGHEQIQAYVADLMTVDGIGEIADVLQLPSPLEHR